VLGCEAPLRRLHRQHVGHQAAAQVRRALADVVGVVLEHHDAGRIVQLQRGGQPLAEGGAQHVCAHAGVVLVDEAPVRAHEGAAAHRRPGRGHGRGQGMARHDLLEQRARPVGVGVGIGIGFSFTDTHAAQLLLAEAQQPACAQDGRGQRIAPGHQLVDGDRLARLDACHQPQVRAGEQADVVGVLPVDALEALRDHQPDARQPLRRRAVLARRAAAPPRSR
jgi:hypothetical protein